mmetsp:Transcript_371/g.942  ORF Transcript_371/g.942 Transcript_371/m.942 type:complete len:199 (-) Transcript_371:252-848(-)
MSMPPSAADLPGVYSFIYAGGEFPVHLRTQGRFFAPQYQARASWELDGNTIKIHWAQFGKYELTTQDGINWEGSYVGEPANWRKMVRKRPFSVAETKLFDSKWMFEHPGGSFEIEFRADGFNHFVCKDFPAHSHWRLVGDSPDEPTLEIAWGQYGDYELKIDASGETMTGSAKGEPSNWRRAKRISGVAAQEEHVHDH